MTKRLVLFLLVVCLFLALCACSSVTSEIITLEGATSPASEANTLYSTSIFSTRNEQEYLQFLTNFDFQTYEIVDISTGLHTYLHGESYVVTYTKKANTDTVETTSYKYYLYKTRSQQEYINFYSSFDFDYRYKYKIAYISTR